MTRTVLVLGRPRGRLFGFRVVISNRGREPIGKFVCGSQPEIKDGSDEVERTNTRSERRTETELDSAIIDELMKGYQRPEDMTGPGGILEQLTKRVYERILGAEMTHYLGYEQGQAPQQEGKKRQKNHRNGTSKK